LESVAPTARDVIATPAAMLSLDVVIRVIAALDHASRTHFVCSQRATSSRAFTLFETRSFNLPNMVYVACMHFESRRALSQP